MAFSKQFEKALDDLFRQRTHWLRSELGLAKPGKPPKFGRKKVNDGINKLQTLASAALSHKLAKSEFEKHVIERKLWHIKGHGSDDKKNQFKAWYKKTGISERGCVYTFWAKGKKPIYVGKTVSGASRPCAQFEKFWFSQVKGVTIYAVKSKGQIPKLECLAIHRFRPTHNKNRAATKKWTKACPLCEIHRSIERELRSIFKLK
jgi:hypothetical protein